MLYFIHLQVCPGIDNFVTVICSGLGVGVPPCGVEFALNYFESNFLKLKLSAKKNTNLVDLKWNAIWAELILSVKPLKKLYPWVLTLKW